MDVDTVALKHFGVDGEPPRRRPPKGVYEDSRHNLHFLDSG
jgi:hypothetical protein